MRQTRTLGVVYWRLEPRMDLPFGDMKRRSLEDHDEMFVGPLADDQAAFYVDSSHATDLKNRRSMGGYVCNIGGSAVLWRAKWQPTVATSSTEA